jgi:APA family basic amino acid/polyamine antiporter
VVVVAAYVLYYIGVAGGASNEALMKEGTFVSLLNLFGPVGGTILNVCIVISCLGTLNGLMLGATRGIYALAARGEGPKPEMFAQVDKSSNMTVNSSVYGLCLCAVWLVYFYGANLTEGWFGPFNFDSSELPIITLYGFYIPMFIQWMRHEKDLGFVKRYLLPILSLGACIFMIFSAIYAHGVIPFQAAQAEGRFALPVLFYMILFGVIMLIGHFFSPLHRLRKR